MIDPATFTRWWTILSDRYARVFESDTTAALYELASKRLTTEQFVAGAQAALSTCAFFPTLDELAAGAKAARSPEIAQLDEQRRRRAETEQLAREAEWRRVRDDAFARWGAENAAEYALISADAWLSLYDGSQLTPIESTPFTRVMYRARLDALLTERLQWTDCDAWIARRYSGRRAS